ncbi:MAG: WYL domain-containing protein [Ethanoligenens sp.]
MLFNEVYSAYFNAVAAILREAVQCAITDQRMSELIREKAFSESVLTVLPALKNEEWLLINKNGQTPMRHPPQMPLTTLEKRWLKTLLSDLRIALFHPGETGLENVEPLFSYDDVVYFDRYADGDPYTDANYIQNFHTILQALREKRKLRISHSSRINRRVSGVFVPFRLEYSAKDDKFRLITSGVWHSRIINLARITQCELLEGYGDGECIPPRQRDASIIFDLMDERNALERVMLHFSDCRKETRRLDERRYTVILWYEPQDETELLIRILSFGPMIRVTAPESFMNLIQERLFLQQKFIME